MTKWAVLTAGLLLLAVGWSPLPGQERNQALRQLREEDRVLSPNLEIREFSGEFERWSKDVTVSSQEVELFRWSTRNSKTSSASWTVLDGPPGSDASVLGSGPAGLAPADGKVTVFRIDFSEFSLSDQPGGTTLWVVLVPVDAAGQPGPQSLPVRIALAGSTGGATPQTDQDDSESEAGESEAFGPEESTAIGYVCMVALRGGPSRPSVLLSLSTRSDCVGSFGTYQFLAFGDKPWDPGDLAGVFRALDALQGEIVLVTFLPNVQQPSSGVALEFRHSIWHSPNTTLGVNP